MTSESSSPLRVLVAEDEPAMLSLVARHMRSLGFSVIEASEGDTAWDLAQQHHPDLVVLDVMMPGMSGWEICKRLKGDASEGRPFSKTGVIMLTGIGENLNEMTSPLFAADAWLNKPFDFAELDSKVRETLSRYAKNVRSTGGEKRASSGDNKAAPSRGAKSRTEAEPPASAKKKASAKNGASRSASAVAASPSKNSKPAAKPAAKKTSAGSSKTAAKTAGVKAGAAKKTAAKTTPKVAAAAKKKPAARGTDKSSAPSRRAR